MNVVIPKLSFSFFIDDFEIDDSVKEAIKSFFELSNNTISFNPNLNHIIVSNKEMKYSIRLYKERIDINYLFDQEPIDLSSIDFLDKLSILENCKEDFLKKINADNFYRLAINHHILFLDKDDSLARSLEKKAIHLGFSNPSEFGFRVNDNVTIKDEVLNNIIILNKGLANIPSNPFDEEKVIVLQIDINTNQNNRNSRFNFKASKNIFSEMLASNANTIDNIINLLEGSS